MKLEVEKNNKISLMNAGGVELVSKGFLGSCWYGNYHYLEPWVGCEHNCSYCYARVRDVVRNSLGSQHFATPRLQRDNFATLLTDIKNELAANDVKTLKLCRYTDIFSPSMVRDGYSYRLLKMIVEETAVKRMIITTKGIPDEQTIELMGKNAEKFSFNIVILPDSEKMMMPIDVANDLKIATAQEIQKRGVQTTIHFDPIGLSLTAPAEEWEQLLIDLNRADLKRVMFSYMVLDQDMMRYMAQTVSESVREELYQYFDLQRGFKYTYVDQPLSYMRVEARQKHLTMLVLLLKKYAFDFVLCSLKSAKGGLNLTGNQDDKNHCPSCTGEFYA